MRARNTPLVILALLMAGAAALAPGCSSDSPSEPSQPPGTPPGPPGGGTFAITVTVTPSTLEAGGTESATIRVEVRRTDNNQPPANGTTVVVSTSLGNLGAPGGPTSNQPVELTNGVGTIAFFPPADPGTAVIQAQLQGSIGQAVVEIAEADAFFISFVNPPVGSPQGGDQVTIQGSGFEAPVRVLFGGANAQVLSMSPNQVRVVTPPSPGAGNQQAVVDVSVTINVNEEEEASDTLAGGFTFSPGGSTSVPAVFSVTPGSGPNEGGTLVVINGEGFVAPVQVVFGQGAVNDFEGQEAQIQSVTPNRIEVLSPAAVGFGQNNQNQLVAILVRNLASGLATVSPARFQYGTPVLITSVAPGIIPYFGGVPVIIFGQGFDNPVAVTLGGIAQPPTSVTGTEIVVATQPIVTASCTDVSGPVSVTNIETGGGATATGITFTYRVVAFSPEIVDVDPNSGTQAGNTLVTITGANLLNPRVTFGGRPAVVTSVAPDGTSVTVRTPFLPDESLRTEACDDNMDGTNGTRFLPTAVDVTVINRDTTCEDTFADAFEYNPSDTTCRDDVGPPPPP